jgi:hypothetical protein
MLPSGTSMGKQCAWIWESPKAVPFRQEKVQPVPRVRAVPHVPEIVKINVSRVWAISRWNMLNGKYSPRHALVRVVTPTHPYDQTKKVSVLYIVMYGQQSPASVKQ